MHSFLDALNTAFMVAMLLFLVVAWPQVLVFWWRKWRKWRKRRNPQRALADELRREGHRWTAEPGRWSVGGETTKEGE